MTYTLLTAKPGCPGSSEPLAGRLQSPRLATAVRFSVSPQVISRVISELEADLGEQLFKRNTRSIRLTDFGTRFLPRSIAFLQEEERLFESGRAEEDELTGTVRITLPPFVYGDTILHRLLVALEPYPQIDIDWRADFDMLKTVEDQIDIGIRISRQPEQQWIARKITTLYEPIVASPALIARTGLPADMHDLVANFPVGNILNPKTGKAWDWFINDHPIALPRAKVVTIDIKGLLQAVLAGRIFAPIIQQDCQPHLDAGRLQVVLNPHDSPIWGIYLYRPYQPMTPRRVLLVFRLLEEILLGPTGAGG